MTLVGPASRAGPRCREPSGTRSPQAPLGSPDLPEARPEYLEPLDHRVAGDGEVDLGTGDAGDGHADDPPVAVHDRPPGVARVHAAVDLDAHQFAPRAPPQAGHRGLAD